MIVRTGIAATGKWQYTIGVRAEELEEEIWITTGQAAALLDMHESTIKRWSNEDRLRVRTTKGGHRRIDLSSLLALADSDLIDQPLAPFGDKAVYVWQVVNAVADNDVQPWIQLMLQWLAEDQVHLAQQLVDYSLNRLEQPLPRLLDQLVGGLMRRVGDLWASGVYDVADEHYATQALVDGLLVARGGRTGIARSPDAPTAVVGCPEGQQHAVGSLAVRLVLESAGWKVYYLGPNVPNESFAAFQKRVKAQLVCISFVAPYGDADAGRIARGLAALYDARAPYALAFGGGGLDSPISDVESFPFSAFAVFSDLERFADWVSEAFDPTATSVQG